MAEDTVGFGPPATTTNTMVSPADTDATGVAVNSADLELLANVMKGE
ncbi:hypothetical protein [Sphingomonas sp. HMP6]|nr:hypothetical protein [Sphingomonas sp. HMP6]